MNVKRALLPLLALLPLAGCGPTIASTHSPTGLELDAPVDARFDVHDLSGATVRGYLPMNEPVEMAPGHYRLVADPQERLVYAEIDVLPGTLTTVTIGALGVACPAGTEAHRAFDVYRPGDDAHVTSPLAQSLGDPIPMAVGGFALLRGDTNRDLWFSEQSVVVSGATTLAPEGGFRNSGDSVEVWDASRLHPLVWVPAGESFCLPAGGYALQRGATWETFAVSENTITDG
jgi:hypothetical protein